MQVEALQAAILAYLRSHPEASDTPRGIVRWWLPGHGMDGAAELIEEALQKLTAAGLLKCIHPPSGQMLYSAGPALRTAGAVDIPNREES